MKNVSSWRWIFFTTGGVLSEYLKNEKAPDILFLDIELPGLNGVEIGKYIRDILKNSGMFLVYISSRKEYAMELFQNQPFDFLVKPISKEKLYQVMEKILNIVGRTEGSFQYKNQGNTYRMMYKDILYFQSEGRKINIVMKNESKIFYGRLNEIEEKIPEKLFLRIHKSYLVNRMYVKEFTYEWVKMINGDVLNISKVNRADVRRKILESEADEFRNM